MVELTIILDSKPLKIMVLRGLVVLNCLIHAPLQKFISRVRVKCRRLLPNLTWFVIVFGQEFIVVDLLPTNPSNRRKSTAKVKQHQQTNLD